MNIKTEFSIKDLESLSGIKAHTIRIWEKRYELLSPMRSSTNIRSYDLNSLQKILNISLLNANGLKVSKIAKLKPDELKNKVLEVYESKSDMTAFINPIKIAMLTFDTWKFAETYNQLTSLFSFEQIFVHVFIPLLEEIGILWQTNSIKPAHERFISNLIKQKILVNIEQLPTADRDLKHVYVLFLPINESHDLGLLYCYYSLLKKGKSAIYLGASVPTDNLQQVQSLHDNITFVSYLTVAPDSSDYNEYLDNLHEEVLSKGDYTLHVSGRMTQIADYNCAKKNILVHNDLRHLIEKVA